MNETGQELNSLKHTYIWAFSIVCLALFLRFETLGQRGFWYDEFYTLNFCKNAASFLEVWKAALVDGWEHPPLHYAVSYLVYSPDISPFGFRIPSAIAGVGTIVFVMALARLLANRQTALLSGLLMSISVYHINYSQDARPYSLMLLFLVMSFYFFYLYIENKKLLIAIPFSLSVLGALYTHHLSIPALATLIFPTLREFYRPIQRANRKNFDVTHYFKQFLIWLLLCSSIIAILYSWQFQLLLQFLGSGKLRPEHTLDITPQLREAVFARWGYGSNIILLTVLTSCFLFGSIAALLRRSRMLVVIPWFAAPFLLFAVLPFSKFYDVRFSMAALPAFYLLISYGLSEVIDLISSRRAAAFKRYFLSITVLGIVLMGLSVYSIFRKTDYRCSNFFHIPEVATKLNGFCERHIILNSLYTKNDFLLKKIHHK